MEKRFEIKITVKGLSLEKLIFLAGEAGIPLRSVKRQGLKTLTAVAPQRDFLRLKEMAGERGWEIEESGAVGLLKMRNKGRRHIGALIGALLMTLVMAAAFLFVWRVELVDAGAYAGDIRLALLEMDIHAGMRKDHVDLDRLNTALTYRYKETAWVQTYFRGTQLVIRVIEGVPVPEVVTEGSPRDVTAKEAGIIVSVEPYAGTPVVKIGDLVKKGQILIKGEERTGGEMRAAVKARGRVMAKTWERAVVRLPAFRVISVPTGRSESRQTIVTPFGTLFNDASAPFEQFDTQVEMWRLAFFPLTLKRETRYEIKTENKRRDENELKQEAAEAAMRKLNEKFKPGDEVIDKWVDYCMIEGTEMEAATAAQILRDIAE